MDNIIQISFGTKTAREMLVELKIRKKYSLLEQTQHSKLNETGILSKKTTPILQ